MYKGHWIKNINGWVPSCQPGEQVPWIPTPPPGPPEVTSAVRVGTATKGDHLLQMHIRRKT